MNYQLVLVRHGESVWNKENLFTGWTDVDLSQTGIREAKEAGRLLKDAGFDFDLCYTSYLKRAIHTLNFILDEMDRTWLEVVKSWRLNERHYGALQGLNKAETAAKYGNEQVKLWRRSFHVMPPKLKADDPRLPSNQVMYRGIERQALPSAESLETTIQRTVPYFEEVIKPSMIEGKRVLIVAHGNSLRALIKYFDQLDDEAIVDVNIPTGIPFVYEFDEYFHVTNHYYLGDPSTLSIKLNAVTEQGIAKVKA